MYKKYSYGTVICSEREIDFLKIQFNSLKAFVNLDDLEILVNTSLPNISFPFQTNRIIYQKQLKTSCFKTGVGSTEAGHDCANRLDMLVREAKGEWVILTHSDMVWKSSIINGINTFSQFNNIGIIDIWRWGMTVVSKEFYELSPFGFYGIANLSTFREYNGQLRIIPPSGPFSDKCEQDKKEATLGLDMGELLEIDCFNKDYKHVVFPDSNKYYHHVGEQSFSWQNDNLAEDEKRARISELNQRRDSFFNEYWRFK